MRNVAGTDHDRSEALPTATTTLQCVLVAQEILAPSMGAQAAAVSMIARGLAITRAARWRRLRTCRIAVATECRIGERAHGMGSVRDGPGADKFKKAEAKLATYRRRTNLAIRYALRTVEESYMSPASAIEILV